jgi:cbb3-type cytochrome oxidase cytochrome c subunit
MRIITFIFVILWTLCSCEINTYDAHSVAGNYVHESNFQLGGTRSSSRSDGSSYANSYENSFRDGANAIGVAVAAKYSFQTHQSDNALSTTKVKANTKPTVTTNTEAATQTVTFPPQQ